jgi:hypothetical protein
MLEPDGWHYVAPKDWGVYSLMVTGKLFEGKKMDIERKKEFRKLTLIETLELLKKVINFNPMYNDSKFFADDITKLIIAK